MAACSLWRTCCRAKPEISDKRPALGFQMSMRIVFLIAPLLLAAPSVFGQARDWALYGGEGGRRFSALTQITQANVGKLEQAWRFDMAEAGDPQTHPLAVDGVVYAY